MNALREVPWRTLTCTRCKQPVQVLELPHLYLDPRTFVAGCCLRAKQPADRRAA